MAISDYFVDVVSDVTIEKTNISIIIRKLAHFAEFMFLGIILYLLKVHTKKIKITEIILICQSVAIIDEFIQSFSDRTDKVTDIIIDISGAVTGILIAFIIKKVSENVRQVKK